MSPKALLVGFILGGGADLCAAERLDSTSAITSPRQVTVRDTIEMTVLGDSGYYDGGGTKFLRVAEFSPDGTKFVIVLRKGNVERNANEFSLLLWHTAKTFEGAHPEVLVTMTSTSNLEAIADVRWLSDNETVMFLGERPDETRQLYVLRVDTHQLTKLTDHRTNLISYSLSADARSIVYLADGPDETLWNDKARREGLIVSPPLGLWDVVAGHRFAQLNPQLFAQVAPQAARRLATTEAFDVSPPSPQSVSPDGRYVVCAALVDDVPETWHGYSDRWIRVAAKESKLRRSSDLRRFVLIDTGTGRSSILLNAPSTLSSRVAWAPDSRSVVISDTFLPLDNIKSEEHHIRQTNTFDVEIKVPDGELVSIGDHEVTQLRLLAWDAKTNQLVFEASSASKEVPPGSIVRFRNIAGQWRRLGGLVEENASPKIAVEEDVNTPPRIVAEDPITHRKAVLLDMNPNFSGLRFGRVENVRIKGTDGYERDAGVYYPVDYISGKKYPLVIQTHGWYPDWRRFWINGFSTTANVAQPLAGMGIMVLQLNDLVSGIGKMDFDHTPKDGPQAVAAYQGAIKYLDQRGLIETSRIGIIGFSVTCYYVKYALTHSRLGFVAASVTDGVDGGYFAYVAATPSVPVLADLEEGWNGAPPFGAGLRSWMARSPGFNLDKVSAPLLITALNPPSALSEWEWFAGLTRLGKPVEMIALQDATHGLEKPLDRMVSLQANLDWFQFWLQDYEDPDSAKAAQYTRWRELRKHRDLQQPKR